MSEEQFKAFTKAIKDNAELQKRIKSASDIDAIIEIVQVAGFMITSETLKAQLEWNDNMQGISDDELDDISGGFGYRNTRHCHH